MRNNSGIIGFKQTVSNTSAFGIFNLIDQQLEKGASNWPIPVVPPPTSEPYFYLTALLLPGKGTNGAQNNTFLDESDNNHTIIRNGNTNQGTFSPFSPKGWSVFFDGVDDYLIVADSVNLRPEDQIFTIEAWIYRSASGVAHTIYAKGGASTGIAFSVTSTNILRFTHTTTNIDSTGTIPAFTWTHVAVVREGTGTNETKLYINGIQDGQGTVSTNFTQTEQVRIGSNRSALEDFFGYISNVRFVKGSAVYTANFTPSTTSLTAITNTNLLTCQSNRFIDNSTNNFTVSRSGDNSPVSIFSPFAPETSWVSSANGGSAYFDGSGDYLAIANTAPLFIGNSDFTLESWVYPTVNKSLCGILSKSTDGGTGGFTLNIDNGTLIFKIGSNNITTSTLIARNTWTHIAATRESTNNRIFINGNLIVSNINGADITTGNLRIGSARSPSNDTNLFQGYISGTRVIKGTALYTANFTVPTSPPATVTNTSLVCNYNNAGIYDATTVNNIETLDNAQISSGNSKFGNTSIYFDGTSDYLMTIDKPILRFGNSAFTIESWIYPISNSVSRTIYAKGNTTFGISDTNNLQFAYTSTVLNSTVKISTNTWTHVAVARSNTDTNATRLYINGEERGNATISTDFIETDEVRIGANSTGAAYFYGYMQDLRVTVGYARYNSNSFTVATSSFPVQ